jgi:hypothetical protein
MPPSVIAIFAPLILPVIITPGGVRAVLTVGLGSVIKIGMIAKMILMLTIVPVLLILSRPAPYLSRELGIEEDVIHRWFRRRIGDGVLEMRAFVLDCLRQRRDLPVQVDRDEYRADTIQYARLVSDRYRTGELIIAVVGGIVSLIVSPLSLPIRIVTIISFYLILLPVSMALRTSTVDVLMYDREAVNTISGPELAFMRSWNKAIAENERLVAQHLLIGLARGESDFGFELAKQVIEDVAVDEQEYEDALDEMVVQVLGEDARIPPRIKGGIRKFRTGDWIFW